jgi:hypothetical protein
MPQDFLHDEVDFALDVYIGNLIHAHAAQRKDAKTILDRETRQKVMRTTREDVEWACTEVRRHLDMAIGFVIGWISRLEVAEDGDSLSDKREAFLQNRKHIEFDYDLGSLIAETIDAYRNDVANQVTAMIPDIIDHCQRIVTEKRERQAASED